MTIRTIQILVRMKDVLILCQQSSRCMLPPHNNMHSKWIITLRCSLASMTLCRLFYSQRINLFTQTNCQSIMNAKHTTYSIEIPDVFVHTHAHIFSHHSLLIEDYFRVSARSNCIPSSSRILKQKKNAENSVQCDICDCYFIKFMLTFVPFIIRLSQRLYLQQSEVGSLEPLLPFKTV